MSGMVAALRERLAAWRYEATPDGAGRRDLRVDVLRGFCVVVMTVDHVGGESSWLYLFTGGNRFFVSAAEGFVFLSGFAMGMVHHGVIRNKGFRVMFEKVFGRAWLLYSVTVVLTILFAAVSTALGTPWSDEATPAKSRFDFTFSVITFHRAYSLTDILVLYTLLVLMAGPAIWLIAHRFGSLVVGASVTVWAVSQVWPDRVPRAWQITDGGFPFSAWQLLFVLGLVLGYHRERLTSYFRPERLFAFGLAAVAALYVVQLVTITFIASPGGSLDVHELLFDKNDARIGRILALFAAAAFLFATVTLAWRPLRRGIGWLLLPMGQRALFAYGVQLFAVAFWSSDLMAPVRLDRENAFFQASAVIAVWLACLAQPTIMRELGQLRARIPWIGRRAPA
jgi:hypothetical protein